jgi:hypothetical protein
MELKFVVIVIRRWISGVATQSHIAYGPMNQKALDKFIRKLEDDDAYSWEIFEWNYAHRYGED